MVLARVAPRESRTRAELTAALEGEVSKAAQTVDLGGWLGLLTADLELSEYGMALRWLAENRDAQDHSRPLRSGVRELLLWLLIRADALLLALMQEWVEQPDRGLPHLERAVDRLMTAAEAMADPNQLIAAPQLSEFLQTVENDPPRKTEALLGRLEILRSLELLDSATTETESAAEPTKRLRRLMSPLRGSLLTDDRVATFLDQQYFRHTIPIAARQKIDHPTSDQLLLWLVRAYEAIQRPLGFTPGRPISLLACCLATRTGTAIEVSDAYECIYGAATTRWTEFLHFSGGSRFDREFLIRVDPSLRDMLEAAVAGQQPSS